jgi:uncharacterized protein DUF1844
MDSEPSELTQEQMDQLHFVGLVRYYEQLAWISLGKLAEPQSGETNVNLELGQHCIDILSMLQRKTVGNVTDDEAGFMKDTIYTLQMNYVDVAAKSAESGEEKTAEETPETAETPVADTPTSDEETETP